MSVSFKAILTIPVTPIDLVGMIQRTYGGDRFNLEFTRENEFYLSFIENLSDEVKAMREIDRKPHYRRRQLQIITHGVNACDYASIKHIDPATVTYLSIGRVGDWEAILMPILNTFGGWINDEANDLGWVRA